MTRGSRIVDSYQVVQNVEQFYIALNNVVNSVSEAYVAQDGVIRQFWPPTVVDGNGIAMTTDTEESYAIKDVGEGIVDALCSWNCRTGQLVLSNEREFKFVPVLAPAPRAAGLYVIRFELVSGDVTIEFPSGEWHDVYEFGNLGIFSNYLRNGNTVQSVLYGELTVSIAEDDGGGLPVLSTMVSKTVNLKSEIIGDNLSWTTAPWTLTDIRYNEFAGVVLLSVPSGYGDANEAFITGNIFVDLPNLNDDYKEVIREIYAVEWGPQFLIKVDVISGSVAGDTTGAFITTDVPRRWEVAAPNPLDIASAVVNITYTDGINFVTKQVTMYAEQKADVNNPGSDISADFTRYDVINDYWRSPINSPPMQAQISLYLLSNGTVNAVGLNRGTVMNFPQTWNDLEPNVPDPQNFECRLTVLSGDPVSAGSDTVGSWINMSQNRAWTYYYTTDVAPPPFVLDGLFGKWQLEIREVGRPETVKTKLMDAAAWIVGPDDGSTPP